MKRHFMSIVLAGIVGSFGSFGSFSLFHLFAHSANADTLGDGWTLLYRCSDLDYESSVESLTIQQAGPRTVGVLRILGNDGTIVEKKYKLDQTGTGKTVSYSSANLSIDIRTDEEIEPGKFAARIFMRDLMFDTDFGACKRVLN